jgi:hypothetical protein
MPPRRRVTAVAGVNVIAALENNSLISDSSLALIGSPTQDTTLQESDETLRRRGGGGRKRKQIQGSATSGLEAAEHIKQRRTVEGTKGIYASKIKTMITWFKDNVPSALDDREDLIIPMETNHCLAFFGNLISPAYSRSLLSSAENIPVGEGDPYSVSVVRGYRSALVDRYTSVNKTLSEDLDVQLNVTLDGYEKTINDLKKRSLMKAHEGKDAISCSGYWTICKKLMMKVPARQVDARNRGNSWLTTVFAWSFWTLMWNLISRSDSIDTLMIQHVEWRDDSLKVEEQGHKGDQSGEDKFQKSVFANPLHPYCCPILSLGVLMFCSGFRPPDSRQNVYSGTNSKDRFSKILKEALNDLDESEVASLGCNVRDIGLHSTRKGAATFCLGQVSGPNPVSVYLRMGQSLGKLKDRYIHFGEGADQLCLRKIIFSIFEHQK